VRATKMVVYLARKAFLGHLLDFGMFGWVNRQGKKTDLMMLRKLRSRCKY